MINKSHFGRRIVRHRKIHELSQSQLAQKLGVTSQAVSKWECGASLPDVEILLELSHLFNISVNELLEDENLISDLATREYEEDGIACFVSQSERDYNIEWAKEIVRGKWIERNWNECKSQSVTVMNEAGAKIARAGGLILEIGADPGGGFVPYILQADPDASVIISDLSPTVVREWKRFLDAELGSPDIFYAAFDFCDIPFADSSFDVVSDGGGIGNAEGDKAIALKEVYRVLKPGGFLVTSTDFVTKETLASLPPQAGRTLTEKRPDVFEDLYEDTVLAGFSRIDSVLGGCWYTDDDDSTIADLARSLGVNLKFTSYIRYCFK